MLRDGLKKYYFFHVRMYVALIRRLSSTVP